MYIMSRICYWARLVREVSQNVRRERYFRNTNVEHIKVLQILVLVSTRVHSFHISLCWLHNLLLLFNSFIAIFVYTLHIQLSVDWFNPSNKWDGDWDNKKTNVRSEWGTMKMPRKCLAQLNWRRQKLLFRFYSKWVKLNQISFISRY